MATTITIEATVQAPVEKVWECWTTPRHIIRWNNASDDWCTLKASNDLKVGGGFSSTMAAKDGSFSFDFEGTYDQVELHRQIEFTMSDGRKVTVTFSPIGNETKITESFEAETENPVEMQRQGWQNILNSFKNYTEGKRNLIVMHFTSDIQAPVEKVFSNMLSEPTYQQWTAEFNPTSHYKGKWEKGARILFIGNNEDGTTGGMVSAIRELVPNSFVSIEHKGMVKGDEEITTGEEVEKWKGSLENYTFINNGGNTVLEIDLDTIPEYESYFEETWPRALNKLKAICES